MADIELVFFCGCPHVDSARAHLREALNAVGRQDGWTEIDLDAPGVPDRVRDCPSPTVLVGGRDVEGPASGVVGRSCRMGGAPSVHTILRALEPVR
ncbi:MAG: hypothetical protein KJO11_11900 [Gemmatimonadetes bacterium]|nr:hypothetical protein [Gemmatimonadota bacterium]NNK64958.1 hypothetical protein [Gemmatimonadota bacterium]